MKIFEDKILKELVKILEESLNLIWKSYKIIWESYMIILESLNSHLEYLKHLEKSWYSRRIFEDFQSCNLNNKTKPYIFSMVSYSFRKFLWNTNSARSAGWQFAEERRLADGWIKRFPHRWLGMKGRW